MFVVSCRAVERVGSDAWNVGRPACPQHLVHPARSLRVRRVLLLEPVGELDLFRIDVRDGEPLWTAVVVDDVHRAPVGDQRHCQPGHHFQRPLVVE